MTPLKVKPEPAKAVSGAIVNSVKFGGRRDANAQARLGLCVTVNC